MRKLFGQQYDDYASRVGMFIPCAFSCGSATRDATDSLEAGLLAGKTVRLVDRSNDGSS